MNELIPVLAGCLLKLMASLFPSGKLRTWGSLAGVLLAALTATAISGEYRISWLYLVVDLAEVMAGFAAVALAVRWLGRTSANQAH